MHNHQLRSVCTIYIVDDPAVAVCNPARQVQVVVKYLRDALVRIRGHVAICVIQVLRCRVGPVLEVERATYRRCRRVVADCRKLIAVVCVCQAVNPALGAAALLAVALEAGQSSDCR